MSVHHDCPLCGGWYRDGERHECDAAGVGERLEADLAHARERIAELEETVDALAVVVGRLRVTWPECECGKIATHQPARQPYLMTHVFYCDEHAIRKAKPPWRPGAIGPDVAFPDAEERRRYQAAVERLRARLRR